MKTAAILLSLAALAAPAQASGGYEWGGSFDVSAYTSIQWIAQKVNGDYADATMKMVLVDLGAAGSTHEALEGVEEASETLLEGTCTAKTTANTVTTALPVDGTACVQLTFNALVSTSIFMIDVTNINYLGFYTEHVPTEFEDTTHYLRAIDGTDIEPLHEMPEVPEKDKEWVLVIVGCALVNLMTFIGVVLLGCGISVTTISPTTHGRLSGFAAGALLSCAVYLILVEAMHLIGTGEGYEEVDQVWRWGTAVLAGFLVSLVLFLLEPGQMSKVTKDKPELLTTLFSVCIGDFMHNLVDGFAIGFAFNQCEKKLAWTILASTAYHELAQEIGDFALLTQDVGLSVPAALLWNFLAGTSVIIGGVIITAVDISDVTTGVLLAFGGGTYVYLAASEALPRAIAYGQQIEEKGNGAVKKHTMNVVSAFIIGAVLIGVVLVEHEHCVPGGGEHAH